MTLAIVCFNYFLFYYFSIKNDLIQIMISKREGPVWVPLEALVLFENHISGPSISVGLGVVSTGKTDSDWQSKGEP